MWPMGLLFRDFMAMDVMRFVGFFRDFRAMDVMKVVGFFRDFTAMDVMRFVPARMGEPVIM